LYSTYNTNVSLVYSLKVKNACHNLILYTQKMKGSMCTLCDSV